MKGNIINEASDFEAPDIKRRNVIAYEVAAGVNAVADYNRRDFYKICINTGKNLINYADKGIETEGTILFFGNPHIPYSWEVLSNEVNGFACAFTEDFLKSHERSDSLQDSPLFKIGGTPVFNLNQEQAIAMTAIFKKIIEEQDSNYVHKDELIRNYINLIIHEALKMQPSENFFKQNNASSRIASLFLELLERQFPIESKESPLQLKTPQDFAQRLSVHVNHLNRSVREVTGKTTMGHIAERIVNEAKALLLHTDWGIAEVGYALGFEYPSNFNKHFKKQTGSVPKAIRG